MAEDLTGFSPLDALGPEFGGINRPNINEVSLRPFEGDRIREPQINFPSPIPMPNLTNPNLNVRKQVVTRPAGQKVDIKNQRQALTDYVKSINQANQSKNVYSKIYSYDAGPDGNAFYKRYMAYGQETFDKIGFSPLRDNEANFNAYTSNWQGAKAMLSQSFMPMLGKGFISGPRDMMKMLSGDFSGTNIADAREYEELAAIGYSSKGGLTGFFNNSAMNFGYSAGIMLEALLEEAAFLGIEALTAGGATPVVAAGTASNVSKIFKGIKGLEFAKDFGKTMKNSLKTLSNFGDAKNFWQSVRASENLGKVGNFLNPAENLFAAVKDMKKLNAVDNLTSLAAISKTAGGFYRDVRNINMATSEARLEAGMVENKVYDKLYNQHYERFGEAPGNEEQKKMLVKSKEASVDTFYKNAGLIFLSNKITFGNITSPRGGIRNFIKTTKDDIVSVGNGKFGNVGKIIYDNAKKQFAFEANNVKNLAKSWYTDFGFKTAAKTVGFFKGNVMEGLQENAQEIISRANERYYTESYRSPLVKSHNFTNGVTNYAAKSKSDYYLEELDNEFSMQGLQTFASGFMMGMFAAPLNNAIPFTSKTFNKIFRPELYQEYVDNKTKITEGLVKSLNDINMGEFLKSRFLNLGAQDIINEIRQSGTKKQAIDAELESLVEATDLMMQTNTTDVFLEKLESLRQMDDKEFADNIGASETDDLNKYRQRIDSTAERLKKIQDKYKYYNEKFPNPVDSNMLEDLDEKSDKYKDLVALQHAWKTSVKNAVFFNEAFEDTVVRMTQISDKITTTSGLKKVSARDFQNILRPETIAGELNLLKNEINALSGIEDKTDLDKASIRAKKEKYKELENFVQAYAKFNSFFNREEYTESIKAELEDELGREPTDAEVAEIYDQVVGAIDNEDARTGIIDELKVAFNGYLKAVANQNDEIAFDENLDRAFELLMDHYKLGQESKKMAKYANVLHDPGNFFGLVQRNKQWMRDLYERRSEYYEEIVKQELNGVEDNALLNELANRGIYVSLDDFTKWKFDGTPPTEFFDNVNKKVIPQGTEEYQDAFMLFRRAGALKEQDIDITNEIVSDQLKLELERLAKEKEQRLEALEEVPVKVGVKSIKKARFKSMSYSYILEQMEPESYADLVIKNKEGQEEDLVVYKDVDGNLRIGDKDGDIINLKDKVKIKKAQQYKIEIKKDPKAVKEINREFTLRRNDLIRSSRVKNKDSFYKNEEELPTQDTPYIDMNEVLQDMLFREFSKMVFSDPVANKRLIDSEKEFETALLKFVKEDPKAKEVIDSYNKAYQTEEKLPDERAELITPKTLEEVEQALEALYTKNLVVNPENPNTYIEVDDQGMRIPGTPTHARISTLKGEYEARSKAPANRGTIIDDMLRDFVEGKITSVDDMTNLYEAHPLRNATEDFSPDFINDLFNIFTDIKKVVDKKGIKLISRIPTLWGEINGKRYAGTIDLMGIDTKGNVYVIDLKTSTQNRRDEAGEYYSNFKEGDTIQQSGYAEMIRQRTGITVKNIVIFPVQTTVVKEFNQYTKAEANKDEKGNFTMQVEIDRNIFPETPIAEEEKVEKAETPTATETIETKEAEITTLETPAVTEEVEVEKSDIEKRREEALEDQKDYLDEQYGILSDETVRDRINSRYDSEYVDAVINGEMTKQEALQALEAAGRKDSDSYNELVSLEEAVEEPTVEETKEEKPAAETKKAEPKIISPKLSEVLGKTVYYNGKPYVVEKEGVRFILNSDTSIIELAGDENSTLESLGVDYFMGDFYKPDYTIEITSETSAIVNDVEYTIQSDDKGNVVGLSPVNKPDQVIKNEKLVIAVEIERNKTDFITANEQLEEVDTEELLDQVQETDPATHQKLMNVERVYNMNWNETVEAGLSNLYSKKPLTESQRLAVDLWVTDAIVNMTRIYNRTSDPIYANGLDNLEIINTLLYEGYAQEPKKTGTVKSAKRTVKQTSAETKRKPGKTITQEVATLPIVSKEVKEKRDRISNFLIGIVWDRLAKEGITNADPIIGTRATITNTDFDKFWSNVKTEDLQKLKKLFEEQKVAELAKVEELGEGAFDPKTGTLTDTASNIESYYNNLISDVSSELNETETKTPESASEFSKGARLIAKNDVFYKDKAGNNSIFAEAQSTVVVTKVDEKTGKITVTPLGNNNAMSYTLEDINSNFEKESTVMQKTQEPQEEIVITDDDKQIIKESTDSIDTFLGEFTTQAEIEKAVDDPKVTLKKLDEDLLDDLKC